MVLHGYHNIYTSDFYKLGISFKEEVFTYSDMLRKSKNTELLYEYFTVKICGILENLGIIMRDEF